ncbi:hypothetical protein [Variovorax sp. LjRoot290]|uniref:hypothetical protein n=1 Tax=Variovorax sp. LjRoot290 TaxID=3342316 RepID=UPI003F51297F
MLYDNLPQIDTAAVVENKRLDHALRAAQAIQAQRDDRRCTPSRTSLVILLTAGSSSP